MAGMNQRLGADGSSANRQAPGADGSYGSSPAPADGASMPRATGQASVSRFGAVLGVLRRCVTLLCSGYDQKAVLGDQLAAASKAADLLSQQETSLRWHLHPGRQSSRNGCAGLEGESGQVAAGVSKLRALLEVFGKEHLAPFRARLASADLQMLRIRPGLLAQGMSVVDRLSARDRIALSQVLVSYCDAADMAQNKCYRNEVIAPVR